MDTGRSGLLSVTCRDERDPCYPNDRQVYSGQPFAGERKARTDERMKPSWAYWRDFQL